MQTTQERKCKEREKRAEKLVRGKKVIRNARKKKLILKRKKE